jgi:putative sporulation protein YtaF
MNWSDLTMLQVLLLVVSLTLDSFVASFAYGTNKIKIPFLSGLVVSSISSVMLGVALILGNLLKSFIPKNLTVGICFAILFILGVGRLLEYSIKKWLSTKASGQHNISFKCWDIHFILDVYMDSTKADSDHSKSLSPKEAISLAIALSLDGIAAGFGAGLTDIQWLPIVLTSFLIGLGAILGGAVIGKKFTDNTEVDLAWLSGALLLVLAFLKLK